MVSFRAWIVCFLCLLVFKQSIGQQQSSPYVDPRSSYLYLGFTVTFRCTPPDAVDVGQIQDSTFWLDSVLQITSRENSFTLTLTPEREESRITCQYRMPTFSSVISDVYILRYDEYPQPNYEPLDSSQGVIESQQYPLICNAPDILAPDVTSYLFESVTGAEAINESSAENNKAVTPVHFEDRSYACYYYIDSYISPKSEVVTLRGTAIESVTAVPSTGEAVQGQNISYFCEPTLHFSATPPPGGHIYTFRWYRLIGLGAVQYPVPDEVTDSGSTTLSFIAEMGISLYCAVAVDNKVFEVSAPRRVTVHDLPRPTITPPTTDFYLDGSVYSFICTTSLTEDVTFSWTLDMAELTTVPSNVLSVTMQTAPYTARIECTIQLSNFNITTSITATTAEMTPENVIPADNSLFPRHGQPFELRCNAPSIFLSHVMVFTFVEVDENGNTQTYYRSNSSFMATPQQLEAYNYTCRYEITGRDAPYSTTPYKLLGTIITGVVTTSSSAQAYYGQNVTFTCQVNVDMDVTAPIGGNVYVVNLYDTDGNIAESATGPEVTLEVILTVNPLSYACQAAVNNDVFVDGPSVSVTGIDLPPSNIPVSALRLYLVGNTYTFTCTSAVEDLVDFTAFSWFVNGSFVSSSITNQYEFYMPYVDYYALLTCQTHYSSYVSPPNPPVVIRVTAVPAPQIITPNPRPVFFSGSDYVFTCQSSLAAIATSYGFDFISDASLSTIQPESSIIIPADIGIPHEFTCSLNVSNSFSPDSLPFEMNVVVIPKPVVPEDEEHYFGGNTYFFRCLPGPIPGVTYTSFKFKHDGAVVANGASDQMNFTLPQPPLTIAVTCISLIDRHESVESDPLTITVEVMPQPSILVIPDEGVFLNGTSYTFNCTSTLPDFVTEYSFRFVNDNTLDSDQASSSISLNANDAQTYQFTCYVSNFNSSSDHSEAQTVVATVPSPPTIRLVDEPTHYLVGTEYTYECESDLEHLVVQYCSKDINTQVTGCLDANIFTFTAYETEQVFQCKAYYREVSTDFSQGVSIIGSGIVDLTASADNPSPYPGTNATLTCSPTLITGYVESDVTFSWKEGASLIAQTKVASEYVTIDMVKSFECEGTTGMVDVTSNVLTITASDLPTPSIEVTNRPPNDNYEPSYFYYMVCNSELEDLLTSYNWYKDGQSVEDVHTKHHLVQAMSYTHNYTCTYVVVTEESPHSSDLMIDTQSILDVHVENNGLNATTLMPLFDSTLTLSCEATIKSTATESPSYSWFQGDTQVGTDEELTIVTYTGYDQTIVCQVTVGDDVMESQQVSITSRDDIPQPEMSLTTHQIIEVLPRASYTLGCISNALSLNTTVTWYKDLSQLFCLYDLTLSIIRYDPLVHDGEYICEVSAFGQTARSEPTTLLAIAPGKECQGSAQCQGEGYTGVCQDQRCVCSDDYKARLDSCVLA